MASADDALRPERRAVAPVAFDPDRDADPVPSPCVNVCELDAARQGCIGCFRLLGEISGWRAMGDGEKRAIWRQVLARRNQAMPQAEGP
ncbi:DUF1289 domain-containing protein [Ottowia oryzae]